MKDIVIAIDGPSASGKSTVARRVAEKKGCVYVDSGSLYRGVTWKMLLEGLSPDNKEAFAIFIENDIRMKFFEDNGAARFEIDGDVPVDELRTESVDDNVSHVSAVPEVRKRVVGWLRGMKDFGSLVIEGRDIGTAVFPDADYKFYLDADPAERARRRHDERVSDKSVIDVKESLERRDAIDSTRKMDPLTVADDAIVIDSTSMTIDDVVDFVIKTIDA
jgi:cytidylate kinase